MARAVSRASEDAVGEALKDIAHNNKFISAGADNLEAALQVRNNGRAREQLRMMKTLMPLLEKEDALYVQQGLTSLSLWGPCSESLKEHLELRTAIEEACREPDPNDGSVGENVGRIVSLIRTHLEKEDKVLLPLIEKQASNLNKPVSDVIALKLLERAYSTLVPLLHVDIPAVRFGTRMTLAYVAQMISTLDTSTARQLIDE